MLQSALSIGVCRVTEATTLYKYKLAQNKSFSYSYMHVSYVHIADYKTMNKDTYSLLLSFHAQS